VQNAVDYADLGVATSGATLFRSIGGTVGTAVLGTIFNNRLDSNVRSAFARHSGVAAQGASSSSGLSKAELERLPPALHLDYLHAFTNSLSTVFEVAAAIGVVAFLLSWLLPEKPLRETAAASSGVGEAFASPREVQSQAEAARALSVLIGRDKRRRLIANLAERAGVDLSPAACWLVVQLQQNPAMDIPATAQAFDIPESVSAAALQELWSRAYVERGDDGTLALTASGNEVAGKLLAERRASLERLCDGWSTDHPDLAGLLTRLAREIQPDRPVEAGSPA
jgi:hypothetical protein